MWRTQEPRACGGHAQWPVTSCPSPCPALALPRQVFGPDTSQERLYNTAVSSIVQEVLEGFNCTIFACASGLPLHHWVCLSAAARLDVQGGAQPAKPHLQRPQASSLAAIPCNAAVPGTRSGPVQTARRARARRTP